MDDFESISILIGTTKIDARSMPMDPVNGSYTNAKVKANPKAKN